MFHGVGPHSPFGVSLLFLSLPFGHGLKVGGPRVQSGAFSRPLVKRLTFTTTLAPARVALCSLLVWLRRQLGASPGKVTGFSTIVAQASFAALFCYCRRFPSWTSSTARPPLTSTEGQDVWCVLCCSLAGCNRGQGGCDGGTEGAGMAAAAAAVGSGGQRWAAVGSGGQQYATRVHRHVRIAFR